MVADHAKRAVTAFPAADRPYYGIDYPARATASADVAPDGDRLDWYRNIPVPTSYMCVGIARTTSSAATTTAPAPASCTGPTTTRAGKKQWTWGNDAFGRAWNRNLTDDGRGRTSS